MNFRIDPLLFLLALLGVGATFMGGMIATGVQPLAPGIGTALYSALGGQDLPTFSHALLGLIVGLGCLAMVLTRRVVQLPQTRVLAPLLLFLGLVAASVTISRFQAVALVSASEWMLFGLTFLFASAAMGRKQGPTLIVGVLFGSILYLASLGLREWKQSPEGWRIFALWTPNTQASVQMVGILLALGLLISREKKSPDEVQARPGESLQMGFLVPFFAVLGLGLMGFAMVLTGSKGGLLALVAGAFFLATSLFVHRVAPKLLPWIGRIGIAAVVLVCLTPGIVSKVPDVSTLKKENESAGTGALSRISNAGATSEQSVGFRKLLWISSYRILKQNPLGTGMGTFLNYSAQPGLITQTQTAHNSILELMVEAGPLAVIALLAFLGFWLESVMRTSDSEPKPRVRLRLAVVSAAIALLFHSATESNLYTFGLGIIFFILLAIASQLSADGVSPEYVPKPGKVLAGFVAVATCLLLLGKGWAEVSRANAKFAILQRDAEGAKAALDSATSLAPEDPEIWSLRANIEQTPTDRTNDLKRALELGPAPRYFRAVAQQQIDLGDRDGAQSTLKECFHWDPNNLPAHLLLMRAIDDKAHPEEGQKAAQDLIDIEKTTYFQIRSIPDLVPTETLSARLELATLSQDSAHRISLLGQALDGFGEYLKRTVPRVQDALKGDPSGSLSPEPVEKVVRVLQEASAASKQLAAIHRQLGHSAEAAEAEGRGKPFEDTLASFAK